MSTLVRRGTVAATVALALVGAGVAPAGAGTNSVTDPAGDVVKFPSSGGQVDAPHNTTVDVVRFVTNHRRRVSLLIEVRDLGEHISMNYAIRTNNGRGSAFLENEGGTVFAGLTFKGDSVCQARIRTKVDQGADTVLFSVPRTCLGRPRWIRTGALAITGDSSGLWFDDARRNGSPDQDDIKLGPRIAK